MTYLNGPASSFTPPTRSSVAAPGPRSPAADRGAIPPTASTNRSFGRILAHPGSWSRTALAWSVVISLVVFVFGNLGFVRAFPVATIGLNLLITIVIFGAMWLLARLLPSRLARFWQVSALAATLIVLAGLRGFALYQLAVIVGFGQDSSPLLRSLVSISVFGPGLVLSVLLVSVATRWRHSESLLRDRADQLESTRRTVRQAGDASIRAIVAGIHAALEDGTAALKSATPSNASSALEALLCDIVKPLSHSLARPTEPTNATPLSLSRPARLAELVRMAHRSGPVAPVASGFLFSLMLLHRALDEGTILEGIAFSGLLGLTVSLGFSLTNRLSQALSTRWPSPLIVLALVLQVTVVGIFLALMTAALTTSDFGLGLLVLVAPITLLLTAVLVGGTRSINQHALEQQVRGQEIAERLRIELSEAQSYQWQRRSALSNWLHGPLQATINSALLRLSQAPSPAAWQKELHEITADLLTHQGEIDQVLTATSDLSLTIERIAQTWEGVTALEWHVSQGLTALEGSAHQGAVADVLVEAVFNAVRHSSPPLIQIYLTGRQGVGVNLQVIHRGTFPSAGMRPGLGTGIYELLTVEYSLTEHPPESRAIASLGLLPGESGVVFDARLVA